MLLSWSTTLHYNFHYFKHVFKRDLTCLNQLFNCFPPLLFIVHTQYFLSRVKSDLLRPHHFDLLSLTLENICLSTTFTRWEKAARKYSSGISPWSFTLGVVRTWPQAPVDGCLSTYCIVLSSSLTVTSMIKKLLYNASSTIFRIAEASIVFELTSKFFGHSCSSDSSPLFYITS